MSKEIGIEAAIEEIDKSISKVKDKDEKKVLELSVKVIKAYLTRTLVSSFNVIFSFSTEIGQTKLLFRQQVRADARHLFCVPALLRGSGDHGSLLPL
jgi:fructose-1,6-bisphosphatase/sedoheptulose 1,7-bisphosphatase-like protein